MIRTAKIRIRIPLLPPHPLPFVVSMMVPKDLLAIEPIRL
jgi:hypothetical protein